MIYCYNETEKPKYCQQYLVIFPVIYSLHIQIKSDMSLKKKKTESYSSLQSSLCYDPCCCPVRCSRGNFQLPPCAVYVDLCANNTRKNNNTDNS